MCKKAEISVLTDLRQQGMCKHARVHAHDDRPRGLSSENRLDACTFTCWEVAETGRTSTFDPTVTRFDAYIFMLSGFIQMGWLCQGQAPASITRAFRRLCVFSTCMTEKAAGMKMATPRPRKWVLRGINAISSFSASLVKNNADCLMSGFMSGI